MWNLDASVKVLGEYTNNIGRNDEINLFDGGSGLIDRLAYGDQDLPGTPRAQNFSVSVPRTMADQSALTAQTGWSLAFLGDEFGTYASTLGDLGNPGLYTLPIPEPATVTLLGLAAAGVLLIGRRRLKQSPAKRDLARAG